jgi:Helix-turn-helix domain of transposase family ISL3
LFEALVMALAKEMPVAAIAALVSEHDTRVWRIVHHYVELAADAQDLSGTEPVGIDDTSFRRGQDYVHHAGPQQTCLRREGCVLDPSSHPLRSSGSGVAGSATVAATASPPTSS